MPGGGARRASPPTSLSGPFFLEGMPAPLSHVSYSSDMPEGDTIWRAARMLNEALAGTRVTSFDLRVPRYATHDLSGTQVVAVRARGKHILMDLHAASSDRLLLLHTTLGMDGVWRLFDKGQPWRGRSFQIRAIVGNEHRTAVGYLLSRVDVVAAANEGRLVGHLGPDLLGVDWDPSRALALLREHPRRAIGSALLDQRNLAGIGNVYKCEICFLHGVNPQAEVGQIADLVEVIETAHRLLAANADSIHRVTTGDPRRPLWVYGRAGKPCRRCGTAIKVAEIGEASQERWTWWCPRCQPL